MLAVERSAGADRQADAVERQSMVAAQGGKFRMRASACAHIILGMDFEKAEPRPARS